MTSVVAGREPIRIIAGRCWRRRTGRHVTRILWSCVGSGYMGGQPRVDGLGVAARSATARCVDLAEAVRGAVGEQPRARYRRARCRPRRRTRERRYPGWPPSGQPPASEPYFETALRRRCSWYSGERQPLSTTNSIPASVAAWRRAPSRAGIEVRYARNLGRRRPSCRRGRRRRPRRAHLGARREGRRWAMRPSRTRTPVEDEDANNW